MNVNSNFDHHSAQYTNARMRKSLNYYSFMLSISPILLALISFTTCSRVLELSDRFLELKSEYEGPWLIKFYAPWCHHCKNLEPIWAQVAQSLYSTSYKVGRIDCTRFTSVASHFSVSGFPTILYIEKDRIFNYRGDRTRNAIVEFAHKMHGNAVREIGSSDAMDAIRNKHKIFFLLISSEAKSEISDAYYQVADKYRHMNYFFSLKNTIADEALSMDLPSAPSVLVFKDSTHYQFYPVDDSKSINESLADWINMERFPLISKISSGNLHEIMLTKKNLVIALLEEIHVGQIKSDHANYMKKYESHCAKNKDKYQSDFVFGWIGDHELTTSLTMMSLPLPNLMILNSTTHHYHLISDTGINPHQISSKQFCKFLDDALISSLPRYGGTGFGSRMYRMYYDITTTFDVMWKGSPILTMLLFGVPLGFLSLICYTTFCSDIMDSNEEDDDYEYEHEKRE